MIIMKAAPTSTAISSPFRSSSSKEPSRLLLPVFAAALIATTTTTTTSTSTSSASVSAIAVVLGVQGYNNVGGVRSTISRGGAFPIRQRRRRNYYRSYFFSPSSFRYAFSPPNDAAAAVGGRRCAVVVVGEEREANDDGVDAEEEDFSKRRFRPLLERCRFLRRPFENGGPGRTGLGLLLRVLLAVRRVAATTAATLALGLALLMLLPSPAQSASAASATAAAKATEISRVLFRSSSPMLAPSSAGGASGAELQQQQQLLQSSSSSDDDVPTAAATVAASVGTDNDRSSPARSSSRSAAGASAATAISVTPPITKGTELILTARLAFSALAGAAVGIERRSQAVKNEHHHAAAAAGVRTQALVSLGAALFTMCSMFGFAGVGGNTRVDPSRMASNVASGVGFVGAGVITTTVVKQQQKNDSDKKQQQETLVHGLTTACAIWLSAALGVASGAGMYYLASAGAILTIAILRFGRVPPPHVRLRRKKKKAAESVAKSAEKDGGAVRQLVPKSPPPPSSKSSLGVFRPTKRGAGDYENFASGRDNAKPLMNPEPKDDDVVEGDGGRERRQRAVSDPVPLRASLRDVAQNLVGTGKIDSSNKVNATREDERTVTVGGGEGSGRDSRGPSESLSFDSDPTRLSTNRDGTAAEPTGRALSNEGGEEGGGREGANASRTYDSQPVDREVQIRVAKRKSSAKETTKESSRTTTTSTEKARNKTPAAEEKRYRPQ